MILVKNYQGFISLQPELPVLVVIRIPKPELLVVNHMRMLIPKPMDPLLPAWDDGLGTNDEGHKPEGLAYGQSNNCFTRAGIRSVLGVAVFKQRGEQLSRMILLPIEQLRLSLRN